MTSKKTLVNVLGIVYVHTKTNDLLLAIDDNGKFMKNSAGEPEVLICNFELIWKIS